MIATHRGSLGRLFLHLVRADVYRLYVRPLKPALGTVARKIVLWRADPAHISSDGTVTGSAGFLIVNAEIGVVSQKVELVAELLDYRAGKVLWFGQSKVMERLVYDGKWTVLARQGRKVDLGIANSRQPNHMRGYPLDWLVISRRNDLGGDGDLIDSAKHWREYPLQRDRIAGGLHLSQCARSECNVPRRWAPVRRNSPRCPNKR